MLPDAEIEPADPPPPLIGRAWAFARDWRVRPSDDAALVPWNWPVTGSIALLIASIPVTVLVGSQIAIERVERQIAELDASVAPGVAIANRRAAEREVMVDLLSRQRVAILLDRLAKVLPGNASIVRISQDSSAVSADVATPDPTELRSAVDSGAGLSGWRTTNERRGDGVMIVTLTERK